MTEQRDTRNPRDWKRIIVAAVSVVLAVLFLGGACLWTLLGCGFAGLAFDDDTRARESLGMAWWRPFITQFLTYFVLPACGIAAGPVILAILAVVWVIRGKGGGG